MTSQPETSTTPMSVFYSYAREDETLCDELEKHLSLLQHQGIITGWHYRLIVPGTNWKQTIDQYLNDASIILLLISADFLASNYHYGIEMQRAMERHEAHEARVLPIILRPVAWESAPFASLQVLPTNSQPVITWSSQDNAFYDVAENIKKVVYGLLAINDARSHMEAECYDQALTAYEQAVQFDRHSAAAYTGKGDALLALGHCRKALDAYGQALQLTPTHPASESGRGAALLGLNRNEEALVAFTQAISHDPALTTALRGKGDALFQLRRYGEALEAYDKALSCNSEDAVSHAGRGHALEQLAQQAFEEAKQLGYNGEIQMEQRNHARIQMQALPMKIEKLTLIQTIPLPKPGPVSPPIRTALQAMLNVPLPAPIHPRNLHLAVLTISPDGKFVAGVPETDLIGKPAGVVLWDVETGEEIRTIGNFTDDILVDSLSFSADGQALLCYVLVYQRSRDGMQNVGREGWEWNVKTSRLLRRFPRSLETKEQVSHLQTYPGSGGGVPLAYSPDGTMITGIINGSQIILWDAPTGKILHMMSDMPFNVTGMSISPDTQLLASRYANGVIKFWSLSTAQLLYTFVGHESLDTRDHSWSTMRRENTLLFSPDGHQIVSAAGEEIKIWEIERLP